MQVSFFGRYSSLFYTPGANLGDLLFNGIDQTAYKRDVAYGVQAEGAWHVSDSHTIRFGALYQADDIESQTSSLVLPPGGVGSPNPNPLCIDPAQTCQTSATPVTIADNGSKHGWNYGLYVQDEWKIFPTLVVNYGLRYDSFGAFDSENQLSPARQYGVGRRTTPPRLHAGFARYFSPPPFELVASTDVALFDNTTAATDHTDTTPKAERADYYDMGVVQKLTDNAQIGLDSFYKASHNLIDEGQFGAPIILTPFNYQTGRQYGMELTTSFQSGGFSAYANASYERADGRHIVSSEFQFNPDDLDYIATHFIPLDHQQIGSVSGGMSYNLDGTLLSADLLFGTGLRKDGATPNGLAVPSYTTVNLGISHTFDFGGFSGVTARADVINVFDDEYEIRDGTGVGVGAPQFRRPARLLLRSFQESLSGRAHPARPGALPLSGGNDEVQTPEYRDHPQDRPAAQPGCGSARGLPVLRVCWPLPSPRWPFRLTCGSRSGCGGKRSATPADSFFWSRFRTELAASACQRCTLFLEPL